MQIDRRNLIRWGVLAGGAAWGSPWMDVANALTPEPHAALEGAQDSGSASSGETRWERSAQRRRQMTQNVTWLTHEPIEFLLRRGDHPADLEEQYQRMLDPRNLRQMAAAGVVYARIFFYKGFGLAYEKPHMQQARQAADLLHQLGVKVSLYIGGTMFTETLYREIPEAQNWEQRDQWNHWVSYGIQTYRHYACPNEPLYRDYLKRVLKIAVEDLRADELAFDNIMLQPEPHSCRCYRCMKAFAVFLKRRYPSSEAAMARFGLPDTDWVRVSQWESENQPNELTTLDDPALQEWVRFRCESLANYSKDLNDYVKSLNPNVACLFNIKGVYSFNRYWTNAVYQPLFAGHLDMMAFDTNGYDAHIDPATGALISQIRSYKMARRIGSSCEDAFNDDLRASVHMAFGHQKPVCVPAPQGSGAFNVFTPVMEFFREYNDRYYTETDNIADVAVLRNWPTMAYSISAAYVPTTLVEQVLIQYKVPFDLIFDEEFDRIGRYAAVLLAGQECVSDTQAAQLLQYVRNGGTLVLAGNTGRFNEWREERAENSLLPPRSEGKGRILYIKQVVRADARPKLSAGNEDPEPGATAQRGVHMNPPQWVLPKNHEEIHATVVAAISGGPTITTDAPLTTVMELLNRSKTDETIVHFVNFDRKNPTAAFSVNLKPQFPAPVKSVTLFSPDADEPVKLDFARQDKAISFRVPPVRLYAMVVIAH